ncbi:hypothetical protein ACQPZQ_02185 [Pseudonocardia sp. CA-142604]|uniref:DivIVA domain-containing protein n=1 Tax=Pseudonocardia sp. CA-142604 TaxID=3240024 RepID=UPI003D8EEC7D
MTTDAGAPGAPRFDVVLRGYDRRQVDEHVARLQRVIARMRADLELARSQPLPVVAQPGGGHPGPGQQAPPGARPRPTPRPRPGGPVPPGESPDMIGSFTDRMQSILQAAEDEAAEIRKKAHAAARAEQETVRAQLADMVRQRDAVLAELTRMRGQLEGLLAAPTARITLPPREGAPSPAARQRDGSGTPKPGPAPASPTGGPASGARPASPSPAPAGRSAGASPADGGPARPTQGGPSRPPAAPVRSGSAAPDGGDPSANRQAARPDAPASPKAQPAAAQSDSRSSSPAAARGESGANASSGADRGSSSSPSQGKTAAHRLPTGGYQAVVSSVEQSGSMRPSTEPEPEPGDLFRPVAGRPGDEQQASERTTAVPQVRPPEKSGTAPVTDGQGRTNVPVDSTVKVNSVRPPGAQDAGRFGSPPGAPPNRAEQKNPRSDEAKDGMRGDGGPGGAGSPDRSGRSPSASRTG